MFFVYAILWLLLNGRATGDVLLTGLVVCGLTYLFTWKVVGLTPRREWQVVRKLPGWARYIALLVAEIVKANLHVIGLICRPGIEMEPQLVPLKTKLRTEGVRVLLANSITLTPGTITVELDEDRLLVHALDVSTAEGLEDTVFERELLKMEEGAK